MQVGVHHPFAPTPPPADGFAALLWAASAIRRGWRLIAVGAAACLTPAVIYLAGAQWMYQATARLLVLQQGGRPLNMANVVPSRPVEGDKDYIPTHTQIISSPLVVQRTIDKGGLENLPGLAAVAKAGGLPLTTALGQLKVTRPDRLAKIVRIDCWSPSPEEAERMLKGVIASYGRFLEDTFQKKGGKVVGLIGRARDDLSQELKDLEGGYIQLRRTSPIAAPDETGRSAANRRVEQWEKAANAAAIKAIELKTQLELGRGMAREGTELWAIAHALTQLGGDSGSMTAAVATGGGRRRARRLHPPAQPGAAAGRREVRPRLRPGPRAPRADRPRPGAGPGLPGAAPAGRGQGPHRLAGAEPRRRRRDAG